MNDAVITISVIMFPGFIATLIVESYLNYSPKWSSFKFGIHAFILGSLTYMMLQVVVWSVGLFPSYVNFLPQLAGDLDIWSIANGGKGNIDLVEVVAAVVLAPLIGIAFVRLANGGKSFYIVTY